MKFHDHSNLEGCHAFLSPSQWHWLNYDDDRLKERYKTIQAAQQGTELHAFAAKCIELKQRLPRSPKTLNLYVNDAITYHMEAEKILYYSDNCFGTADSISFKNNFLRIHDLKTGELKAHMEQLEVYAALYCLEYHVDPNKIEIELRIYQSNEVGILNTQSDYVRDDGTVGNLRTDVLYIMDKIRHSDSILKELQEGAN